MTSPRKVNSAPKTFPADTLPRPAPAGRPLPRDQRAARSEGPLPVIPPHLPSDPKRVRITKRNIDKYGTTPGCPRCADLNFGNQRTKKTHNEACRKRFYALFKADSDAKWAQAAHAYQRRMSRGGDLHQPHGANFASPASPVDLDEVEPPPAKKSRREDLNAKESDADSEEEAEEPVEDSKIDVEPALPDNNPQGLPSTASSSAAPGAAKVILPPKAQPAKTDAVQQARTKI